MKRGNVNFQRGGKHVFCSSSLNKYTTLLNYCLIVHIFGVLLNSLQSVHSTSLLNIAMYLHHHLFTILILTTRPLSWWQWLARCFSSLLPSMSLHHSTYTFPSFISGILQSLSSSFYWHKWKQFSSFVIHVFFPHRIPLFSHISQILLYSQYSKFSISKNDLYLNITPNSLIFVLELLLGYTDDSSNVTYPQIISSSDIQWTRLSRPFVIISMGLRWAILIYKIKF